MSSLPFEIVRFLKDTPKSNTVSVKSKKPSTFHEFARSTNDAWDIDDEEDSGFFTPAHSTSVPAQSHSTVKALRLKETIRVTDKEPEPCPGDRLEPGSTEVCRDQLKTDSESANGRVVKSSSDVQLNSNSGPKLLTMFLFWNTRDVQYRAAKDLPKHYTYNPRQIKTYW